MNKPIILIVDDVVDNIDILKSILCDEYNLKVALSGEVAIKAALAKPQPELILLDIVMPEMDGYTTCAKLKSDIRTRDIPVIFVTAKNEIIDEVTGFTAGAVDYISKPPTPLVLKSRVRSHLSLYHRKKELWRQVQEQTKELRDTQSEVICQLGRAAEFKDNETGLHVIRMSHYCRAIALAYGLNEKQADLIQDASPMHDIGKLGVPDYILQKPGPLDAAEWVNISKHPQIGADILGTCSTSTLTHEASIIALTHHEWWNGKGYPNKIAGETIPLTGRICALADVYDALMSKRPYKDEWPADKAVEYIQSKSGSQFDPMVVEAFIKALPQIEEIRLVYSDE